MSDSDNELRREIQEKCALVSSRRRPAIRRSMQEQFLYATDLPQIAEDSSVKQFIRMLCAAGWRAELSNGWLQLDKLSLFPPAGWYSGPFGAEAFCCMSILTRHRGQTIPSDGSVERLFIKAAETGPEKYEAACRKVHAEWAERLRMRKHIPDIHPDFFTGGETTC